MGQTDWNSPLSHAAQPGASAAVPPGLPAAREGDRERRAATGRPAAVGALVVRRAGRQPRHRPASDRGARRRRPGREPRARLVRDRRRAGRAREHADEPVGAGPLARARGQRARARRARCGRRRSTRRRRSGSRPAPSCSSSGACGCSTGCRSRSTSTGCRCGSRPSWPSWTSPAPRCTRRSTAPATRPRARTTSSRPAAPRRPRPSSSDWRSARRSCLRRRSRSARTAGSWTSVRLCIAPTATGFRRR